MTPTASNAFRPLLVALATAVLLGGGTTHAQQHVRLDTSAMPVKDSKDKPLTKVGVDLTCEGGFTVVVTAKDRGGLGNVALDSYAVDALREDALERVFTTDAAFRMGVFTPAVDGVVVEVDDVSRRQLVALATQRLQATGCRIGEAIAGDYGFAFADGHGDTYIATFGTTSAGARVYIGH
ncbi:MAG: hypothetical protein P1P87_11685 [Trueperaceae bacterium]|nr:hypothetical protein [Trueperaceae bacterium]